MINLNELLKDKRIETERLVLRHYEKKDAKPLFELSSDRDTCYFDGGYEPETIMNEAYFDSMHEIFLGDVSRYVICLKETDEAIGILHIMEEVRIVPAVELGFVMNPSARRKGYMVEALRALIGVLFDLGVDMVVTGTHPENVASISLLKKLGFRQEGFRHKGFYDAWLKKPVDELRFYLDRT